MSDPTIRADKLLSFGTRFLTAMGCAPAIAAEVSEHLIEAELCGIYSHGVFRFTQYLEQARAGMYRPEGLPKLTTAEGGGKLVDGGNGLGIPAMRLAADEAVADAKKSGVAAIGVMNVGHTGRMGVFAERAALAGCLGITFGGGSRKEWRQVAPFGGAKAILPTNPYAFAIPGGEQGPVVLDFATSAGAGGKVHAAKSAGRPLPPGLLIDAKGNPSTNPDDYYNGGALLPMAGPKGYGMALVAELLGEAIFGEAMSGMNWIMIAVDLSRFRSGTSYRMAAEDCLQELRATPPAPGFARVEIPGERERALRAERLRDGMPVPPATLDELRQAARSLGLSTEELDRA